MNMAVITVPHHTAITLGDEISTLYAHINAATFSLLEKIHHFDEQQLYVQLNCKSTAHWLNYACGISLVAGREKVRVARALAKLPRIEAAFRAGRLSYSKARAVTRVATVDNEGHFLNIACHSTASQTERIVRNHSNVSAVAEDQAQTERALRFQQLPDGSLAFRGRLSADQGALLVKALEQTFMTHDGRTPSAAAYEDEETVSTKRADALVLICEQALAAQPRSSSTADRYQVMVHVNAATLTADAKLDPDDPPEIEGVGVVSVKTAERLSCDASTVPLVESASGEPLSIGRKQRTVSPALRRALKRRDRGCRFPGCEQIHYVDAHHIRHWAHGGKTNLDNLMLLCRYHHRLLHEGGYCVSGADGAGKGARFLDPTGSEIPSNCDDLSGGNTNVLVKNASAEAPLTPASLTPELDGRPPDYHHIAWVLSRITGTSPGPVLRTTLHEPVGIHQSE